MNANGTKFLCQVNSQEIQDSLGLLYSISKNVESFDEMEITRVFRESNVEVKSHFLSKILKLGQYVTILSLPYEIYIFQENVQLVFVLLIQILGLDNDKNVTKLMLGCLLKVFQSELVPVCLKFDEFLVKAIHA